MAFFVIRRSLWQWMLIEVLKALFHPICRTLPIATLTICATGVNKVVSTFPVKNPHTSTRASWLVGVTAI